MVAVLTLHHCSTLALVGLIWVVQLVHYPSFHFVEEKRFAEFERFHGIRISFIVMPLMLTEAAGAIMLWVLGWASPLIPQLALINLSLLIGVWLVTFLVSVPCHRALAHGYQKKVVDRLIVTNWLRTLLWSGKGLLVAQGFIF